MGMMQMFWGSDHNCVELRIGNEIFERPVSPRMTMALELSLQCNRIGVAHCCEFGLGAVRKDLGVIASKLAKPGQAHPDLF